jgi:Cdc6-like AAA superfamily ATPase
MKKTKIKKLTQVSLKKLPTITKSQRSSSEETGYPIDTISYSKMVKFSTNPIMFKINALNGQNIDTLMGISGLVGRAFHVAMETYQGGNELKPILNEHDGIKQGLEVGTDFLDKYPEGFIKFSTTIPTKQKAIEKFVFMFQSYVKERPYKADSLIAVEDNISEYIDVEWRGKKINFPIKLRGYLDIVFKDPINPEEYGIEDYKTVSAYSSEDKIDGAKMLQAVEYYFLAYAKYGKAPKYMLFSEVKNSKNRDNSPQVRLYKVVYEENELFFDFYFRMYADLLKALRGEMVYVPNIHTLFDGDISLIAYIHRLDEPEELAKKMKELQIDNITDLLKAEVQNTSSMKNYMETLQKSFQSYKSLNYQKMTLTEKIQTKLMEFGILVNFDSEVVGNSVTQYRYIPSIGVKMKTIESHVKDIEQVVGVAGIRILAPIPNTSFVGFEVPNAKRTFLGVAPKGKGFEIAIGVDIMGNTRYFDLRESPHMLIAGATGSGKSVFVNNLISQLQSVPNVHLHLFDPKQVELAHFEGTERVKEYSSDIEEIHEALEALVVEMNERYTILKHAGVRNIQSYTGRMAYKFVFIDEYGDLIASNYIKREAYKTGKIFEKGARAGEEEIKFIETNVSKEIEKNILILGQKARAAGIHLIISTQRPSVDIVSGSIKNNFPTKVAFRMANSTDSQVAINQLGAENLLGKGDMLFIADNGSERLQGFSE